MPFTSTAKPMLHAARLMAAWRDLSPILRAVLRVVIGLQFMQYGSMKLFAYPASLSGGEPLPPLLIAAGVIELVGGTLVTVGLLTRFTAFVLSGEMAFAYFLWHAPKGAWPAMNGGDLAITWCFALLFLSASGAGPWSIDSARLRH